MGNNADRHRVTRGLSNSFRRLSVVLVSAVRRVTVIVWLPGAVKGLLHIPYFLRYACRVLLGLLQFTVLSVLYRTRMHTGPATQLRACRVCAAACPGDDSRGAEGAVGNRGVTPSPGTQQQFTMGVVC